MTISITAKPEPYRVVQENGWSFVVGEPTINGVGPWRYKEDAQEVADEINARLLRFQS